MNKTLLIIVLTALLWSCKSDKTSTSDQTASASEEKIEKPEVSTTAEPKELEEIKEENTAVTEVAEPVEQKTVAKPKPVKQKPQKPKEEVVPAQPQPVVQPKVEIERKTGHPSFANAVFNMDTLEAGDVVEHKFYFTNTGKDPLNVMKVDVTCGCTVPSFPIVPIMPGEEGFIGVTYNSVGKKGKVRPKVTIITDGIPTEVDLYLDGFVLEKSDK